MNYGYLTWRILYICDNISLKSSSNEKYYIQKLWRKLKDTFYVQ